MIDIDTKRLVHKADSTNEGWVIDKPGIQYSLVHVDKSQGLWVTKARFEAGTLIPYHLHTGVVIGYTTKGTWGYPNDGAWFNAGDYCFEPSGTYHEIEIPSSNREVTEAIFMMWGALITFEENYTGKIKDYTDATTIENEYLYLCKKQHIKPTKYISF